MGFLGLSEPIEKEENLFTRLFWPGDHAGEADSLGQQGFWICMIVAALSFVVLLFHGQPITGILTLAFFTLGGVGVREHSTAAAALVAVAYVLNQVANVMMGLFPGLLGIAAMVLLIANIRGTYIASKWAKRGDPELIPERMNETFKDRFVDQMPAKVWPRTKIAFYVIAFIYVLLTILGTIAVAAKLGRSATPVHDADSLSTEVHSR